MKLRKLAAAAALMVAAWAPARASVVSDTFTDVLASKAGDLLVTRKVRRNAELNQEQAVWEIFSKGSPGRALMGLAIKDGKLAMHWEWTEGLQALHDREGVMEILQRVSVKGGTATDVPNLSGAAVRSLLISRLKLAPLDAKPACGALLTEEDSGYGFAMGTFTRHLPWVHKNSEGKAFLRHPGRCYEAASSVLGVIITMTGTAISEPEKGGKAVDYPNFSTETLIWTFAPPQS